MDTIDLIRSYRFHKIVKISRDSEAAPMHKLSSCFLCAAMDAFIDLKASVEAQDMVVKSQSEFLARDWLLRCLMPSGMTIP